ncbi:MAG: hypothetical protein D6704_05465 [Nitrospirae bacterium]|nr:MAG: hypothetical protein D6704_05465 [Nitrospirota bacterium]
MVRKATPVVHRAVLYCHKNRLEGDSSSTVKRLPGSINTHALLMITAETSCEINKAGFGVLRHGIGKLEE